MDQFETKRLYLVPFSFEFTENIFELHSNPEVHQFLQHNMIQEKHEAVQIVEGVLNQYIQFNTGRYIVLTKDSMEFVGWCGIKFNTETINGYSDYYDIGYRFLPQFWGKGIASESAKFFVDYAFNTMKINTIYATADCNNFASICVLEKCGLNKTKTFNYQKQPTYWFEGHHPSKEILKRS